MGLELSCSTGRGLVSTSVQLCHVRQREQARRAVGQLVMMPLRGLHVTAPITPCWVVINDAVR
jgi:hypothetical protein